MMTYKGALENRKRCLEYLEGLKGRATPENVDAVRLSIEALEKAEKYRWHDIRKHPEDLPPVEVEVDVVCERRFKDGETYRVRTHGFYEDGTLLEDDSDWNWTDIDGEWCEEEDCYYVPEGWWEYRHYNPDDVYNNIIDDRVIAWRYIEEFEEE